MQYNSSEQRAEAVSVIFPEWYIAFTCVRPVVQRLVSGPECFCGGGLLIEVLARAGVALPPHLV
jgi:hypothetical protein